MLTKEIWFQRHGECLVDPSPQAGMWQPSAPLTENGRALLTEVRRRYFAGKHFELLYHSPFIRAKQTAEIIVPDGNWEAMAELAPCLKDELERQLVTTPKEKWPTSHEELDRFYPGLLESEESWVCSGVQKVLNFLKEGQGALLIGHQPHLDLLRRHFDSSFPRLGQVASKGDIYLMEFGDNNHLVGFKHLVA